MRRAGDRRCMSADVVIVTHDEEGTIAAGERLGKVLSRGDVVCLYGDLGAGKTTFVKGIARALGVDDSEVTSASFVIIAEHQGRVPLFHIDLYRVDGGADLLDLGLEEYLDGEGVSVVEWAERLEGWECSFSVNIAFLDGGGREITVRGERDGLSLLRQEV